MLRILVVALVMLVAVMFVLPRGGVPAPETATVLTEPRPLPSIELVSKTGERTSTDDLAGRHTLLFFGFTHCPDICPLTLQVLATAVAEIESRAPRAVPQVAFISVDPYRDSPQRIARYLDNFDSDFIGLTASDERLAPLLEMLGVMVHKNERDGEPYNVVHNGTIYVLDADGRWIAIFGGSSHNADAIVTDYLRIRAAGLPAR